MSKSQNKKEKIPFHILYDQNNIKRFDSKYNIIEPNKTYDFKKLNESIFINSPSKKVTLESDQRSSQKYIAIRDKTNSQVSQYSSSSKQRRSKKKLSDHIQHIHKKSINLNQQEEDQQIQDTIIESQTIKLNNLQNQYYQKFPKHNQQIDQPFIKNSYQYNHRQIRSQTNPNQKAQTHQNFYKNIYEQQKQHNKTQKSDFLSKQKQQREQHQKISQSLISDVWTKEYLYQADQNTSTAEKIKIIKEEIDDIPKSYLIGTAYLPNKNNPNDILNLKYKQKYKQNQSTQINKNQKINSKNSKIRSQTNINSNKNYNPNFEIPNLSQNLKDKVFNLRAIWIKNNDQLKATMQSLGIDNYQKIIKDAVKHNNSQTKLQMQQSNMIQHKNSFNMTSPIRSKNVSQDKQWLGSLSPVKKRRPSPRKSLQFMLNQEQSDTIQEKDDVIIDEEDSLLSQISEKSSLNNIHNSNKNQSNNNNNIKKSQEESNQQIGEIKLDFNRAESEQYLNIESQPNIPTQTQIDDHNSINIENKNINNFQEGPLSLQKGDSVLIQSKQPTERNSIKLNNSTIQSPFLFHQKSMMQQSTLIQQYNNNQLYQSIIMAKQNIQNNLHKKKSEKNSQIMQKERQIKRQQRRQGFQNLSQNKALTFIEKVRPQTVDYLPLWIRTRQDFLKLYYKDIAQENLQIPSLCSKPTQYQVQKLTEASKQFIEIISKQTTEVNTYVTDGRTKKDIDQIIKFMEKCDCFKNMQQNLKKIFATYLEVDIYWKNQIVQEDKEYIDSLYIIYDGKLALKEIKQTFEEKQPLDKTCLQFKTQYENQNQTQQIYKEKKTKNMENLENYLETYIKNIDHYLQNKTDFLKQTYPNYYHNSQLQENLDNFLINFHNFEQQIIKNDISQIILNESQMEILKQFYNQLENFQTQDQIIKSKDHNIKNKEEKHEKESRKLKYSQKIIENLQNFLNNSEIFYKNMSQFYQIQEQCKIQEISLKNKVKSDITKQILSSKILKTWKKHENTPTLALNIPYDISSNHFLVAQEQVILLSIKQEKYQELSKKLKPTDQALFDKFKIWNNFFKNFDDESLKKMIQKMQAKVYFEGDTIYRYLDEPDNFYYIQQGQAIKQKIIQKVNKNIWPITKKTGHDSHQSYEKPHISKRNKLIKEEEFFGEEEIIQNLQRKFTVIAKTHLVVLILKKKDFKEIFVTDKQKNFFNQNIQKQSVQEDIDNQWDLSNVNQNDIKIFTEKQPQKNSLNYNQIQEQKSQYNKSFKKIIKNAIQTSYSVNLTTSEIEKKQEKVKNFINYLDEVDFTQKRQYKHDEDYEHHHLQYNQLIKN